MTAVESFIIALIMALGLSGASAQTIEDSLNAHNIDMTTQQQMQVYNWAHDPNLNIYAQSAEVIQMQKSLNEGFSVGVTDFADLYYNFMDDYNILSDTGSGGLSFDAPIVVEQEGAGSANLPRKWVLDNGDIVLWEVTETPDYDPLFPEKKYVRYALNLYTFDGSILNLMSGNVIDYGMHNNYEQIWGQYFYPTLYYNDNGILTCTFWNDFFVWDRENSKYVSYSDVITNSFPEAGRGTVAEEETEEGTYQIVDGNLVLPDGTVICPNGDGTFTLPDGTVVTVGEDNVTIGNKDYPLNRDKLDSNQLLNDIFDRLKDVVGDLTDDLPWETPEESENENTLEGVEMVTGVIADLLPNPKITNVFPFCLPWDLVRGIKLLSAPQVSPYFEIPFKVSYRQFNIDDKIILDFGKYTQYFIIVRWMETIAFIFFLIDKTRSIVYGGD